jgi:hypothetical protein
MSGTSLGGHIAAAVDFYLLAGIVLMTACKLLHVKGGEKVQSMCEAPDCLLSGSRLF